MLAMQERYDLMLPDPIGVAHDVNQAIYDTLTPKPIAPEKYDLALIPAEDWGAVEAEWMSQLCAIFREVRKKYQILPIRPTRRDAAATMQVPLSTTHELIVGRIFSPSLRHALKRRLLAVRRHPALKGERTHHR